MPFVRYSNFRVVDNASEGEGTLCSNRRRMRVRTRRRGRRGLLVRNCTKALWNDVSSERREQTSGVQVLLPVRHKTLRGRAWTDDYFCPAVITPSVRCIRITILYYTILYDTIRYDTTYDTSLKLLLLLLYLTGTRNYVAAVGIPFYSFENRGRLCCCALRLSCIFTYSFPMF